MELKVPPAIVFLFFAGLMYLLRTFLPIGGFDFFGRRFLEFFLAGVAIIVAVVALIQFFLSKTTIDPSKPQKTNALVTTGLYNYSRNPMYLAMLLLLLAWILVLGNAFNILLTAGFVGYMNRFQIVPEEEILQKRFGKDYANYKVLVRRWF